MNTFFKAALVSALFINSSIADSITHGSTTINMGFVDIGHAGNTTDQTGYGAVAYNYRIGKYEVTIDQFQKVLGQGTGNYWNDGTRSVGNNAPAANMYWADAARFCNWLTSGDISLGAYQFNANTLSGVDRDTAIATYETVYVLPTEDEWYKAAYFKADASGFSLYANGSDSAASVTQGTSNGWNFYADDFVNNQPNYTWEIGFGAEEQNGTHDMMGNVWEWNESAFDGILNDLPEDRVVRGGAFNEGENILSSNSSRQHISPGLFWPDIGFRVAAIPEPSSIMLMAVFGFGGWFVRRLYPRV